MSPGDDIRGSAEIAGQGDGLLVLTVAQRQQGGGVHMGENGLIREGGVGKAPNHLRHRRTGKAVEGVVQQQKGLAAGFLFVQDPGHIGAAFPTT